VKQLVSVLPDRLHIRIASQFDEVILNGHRLRLLVLSYGYTNHRSSIYFRKSTRRLHACVYNLKAS